MKYWYSIGLPSSGSIFTSGALTSWMRQHNILFMSTSRGLRVVTLEWGAFIEVLAGGSSTILPLLGGTSRRDDGCGFLSRSHLRSFSILDFQVRISRYLTCLTFLLVRYEIFFCCERPETLVEFFNLTWRFNSTTLLRPLPLSTMCNRLTYHEHALFSDLSTTLGLLAFRFFLFLSSCVYGVWCSDLPQTNQNYPSCW